MSGLTALIMLAFGALLTIVLALWLSLRGGRSSERSRRATTAYPQNEDGRSGGRPGLAQEPPLLDDPFASFEDSAPRRRTR